MGQAQHKILHNSFDGEDALSLAAYARFTHGDVHVYLANVNTADDSAIDTLLQLPRVWAMRDYFSTDVSTDDAYAKISGPVVTAYDIRGKLARQALRDDPQAVYENAINYQLPFVQAKVSERGQATLERDVNELARTATQTVLNAAAVTEAEAKKLLRDVMALFVVSEATCSSYSEQHRVFLFESEHDAAAMAKEISRYAATVGDLPSAPTVDAANEETVLLK